MKLLNLIAVTVLLTAQSMVAQESAKLIPAQIISDGTSGAENTAALAFDGQISTGFKSTNATHAWTGMDLGKKCVITRLRWAPYQESGEDEETDYSSMVQLGIFEGANNRDFSDAIPLYMIPESSSDGQMEDAEVDVTRGFRYVRYVGPNNSYGYISEIEFWGYEGEGTDDRFYQPTNLPLVVINQDNMSDPSDKVTLLPAHGFVIYTTKKGKSKIIGDSCTIRGRGNYSWRGLPKKPYRVKFNSKIEMPRGGSKAKKWTLIPSYGDKTLMRNILAFDISRRFEMPYTPYCQAVDLILNGEYKGCYELCDQLEVSKNRLNIDEMVEADTIGDTVSGGYFYEYDGQMNFKSLSGWQKLSDKGKATYDVGFYTSVYNNPITIKSPNEDVMQQVQYEYLRSYLDEVELKNNDLDAGLIDCLNFDSFARFFIISEFVANTDTFFELYQYKKRGDNHVYFGPIWDCDLGFDNDNRTHTYLSNPDATGWTFENGGSAIEDWNSCGAMRTYAANLLKYAQATQSLEENWAYVRASRVISNDSLQDLITVLADSLDMSQKLNFKRWPILDAIVHNNYQALGSYDAEVGTIRSYIPRRIEWMDGKFNLTDASLTIEISNASWATVYLPIACKVPEKMMAYSVAGINEENKLILQSVSTMYPNLPYLLYASPGHYTLEGYGVTSVDEHGLGLLTGTDQGTYVPEGAYVLQNHNGHVAFYRVEDANTIAVGAGHAYLSLPLSEQNAPVRSFPLDWQADVLESVENSDGSVKIFDIAGHLIQEYDSGWTESAINGVLNQGIYIIDKGGSNRKLLLHK